MIEEQKVKWKKEELDQKNHKKQKKSKAEEWNEQVKKSKDQIDKETQTHEIQQLWR